MDKGWGTREAFNGTCSLAVLVEAGVVVVVAVVFMVALNVAVLCAVSRTLLEGIMVPCVD